MSMCQYVLTSESVLLLATKEEKEMSQCVSVGSDLKLQGGYQQSSQ